jgi:hypothetical protein
MASVKSIVFMREALSKGVSSGVWSNLNVGGERTEKSKSLEKNDTKWDVCYATRNMNNLDPTGNWTGWKFLITRGMCDLSSMSSTT